MIGHGDYRYRVHRHWGDLDPGVHPVKDCHEMVMDAKGRLIMIGNHTKNNVLIYDKSGKLLDFWGIRYVHGHGLTLWEAGGEEFLFLCDCSRDGTLAGAGHVIKTTLDGRELMLIEHPSKYGALEEDEVWSPTETAIGPNGDIYVADGYASCYIFQFSAKGEFIRRFGGRGDGEDQFQTAHGIAIDDRDPANPTLLVTSRAHNMFKRFTLDGEFIESDHFPGAFVCRPVISGKQLYTGVCWTSDIDNDPDDSEGTHPYFVSPNSGCVLILDEHNEVVSIPGGKAPGDGHRIRNLDDRVFDHCHDVCVDEDDNLYICQWNAGGSYPMKLERV